MTRSKSVTRYRDLGMMLTTLITMMLAGCAIPSSGLMRYLPSILVDVGVDPFDAPDAGDDDFERIDSRGRVMNRYLTNTLPQRSQRSSRWIGSVVGLICAVWSARASGEDIYKLGADGSPQQNPQWAGAKIVDVAEGKLVFQTSAGEARSADVTGIFRITSPADGSLNAGEEAYVARQFDKAIDAYKKAVATRDAWKIKWCVPRLIDAANRSRRFDAALAGYIAMARVDATAASTIKPTLPARGSKFLDDAARELSSASRAATADPERQAILSLLLDVQLARGDQADAEATVDALLKLAGANANDPKLAALVGEIRLGQARVALEARRFADISKAIDAASPHLIEPRQQAEALYLRGQALLGLAAPGDKPARLDAALAFMRVVAHFHDVDGQPFVAPAMVAASDALESAGEADAARSLRAELGRDPAATSGAATSEAATPVARDPSSK